MSAPWYADRNNLVILTAHMAQNGYSAPDVAYAVEKPWKYEDAYADALVEIATEESTT